MKFFLIVGIYSLFNSAAWAGRLISINNDTCWFKEENSRVKIASFNDQVSLNTSKDEVLGEFVKYLDVQGFQAEKIDAIHTYGLCGPRLAFAMKLSYEKVNYCIHAYVEDKTKVKFGKVSLASSASGACEQISPEKLIISIDEKNRSGLESLIKDSGHSIKSSNKISTSTYAYEFKVVGDEIKDIKKEVEKSGLARSVDFSTGQYHISDKFELLSLSFFRK